MITVEQCQPGFECLQGSEIPNWQVKEEPAPFLAITSKSNKIVELAARSLKHDFMRTGLGGSIDRGNRGAKSALGLNNNKNHKRV